MNFNIRAVFLTVMGLGLSCAQKESAPNFTSAKDVELLPGHVRKAPTPIRDAIRPYKKEFPKRVPSSVEVTEWEMDEVRKGKSEVERPAETYISPTHPVPRAP